MIDTPSRLRLIRKESSLSSSSPYFDLPDLRTPLGESTSTKPPSLIALTELLKLQKSGQFPDETVRIKV